MTSKDFGQSSLKPWWELFPNSWPDMGGIRFAPVVPALPRRCFAFACRTCPHIICAKPSMEASKWMNRMIWCNDCSVNLEQQIVACIQTYRIWNNKNMFSPVGSMLKGKGSLISDHINYTWVPSAVACLHGKDLPAKIQRYILTIYTIYTYFQVILILMMILRILILMLIMVMMIGD